MLQHYLTRRIRSTTQVEEAPRPRAGLLSLRSAVIFALATAGGLLTGIWSEPTFGLGAWIALVIGLDTIIDRERLN